MHARALVPKPKALHDLTPSSPSHDAAVPPIPSCKVCTAAAGGSLVLKQSGFRVYAKDWNVTRTRSGLWKACYGVMCEGCQVLVVKRGIY